MNIQGLVAELVAEGGDAQRRTTAVYPDGTLLNSLPFFVSQYHGAADLPNGIVEVRGSTPLGSTENPTGRGE